MAGSLRVLHLIQQLSLGGASRALMAGVGASKAGNHRVVSLAPAHPAAAAVALRAGLALADAAALAAEITAADIVHVHFWNTPELYEVLRSGLPACRILLTCHVGGLLAPQVLTREVIELADLVLVTSPHTLEGLAPPHLAKALLAPECCDFSRLAGAEPLGHDGFNVGYIGTVDFCKMHPDFVRLHAGIEAPDLRVIVCGEGAARRPLERQIAELCLQDRFDLRGRVEDIGGVLRVLDVFGYPLCEDNYATSELVLHEAMYAGVPAVVFRQGGAARTVVNGETGLIIDTADEYVTAVERLCHDPEERRRLSAGAAAFARARLGAENLSPLIDAAYARVMETPKRARDGRAVSGAAAFIQSLGDTAATFEAGLAEDRAADAVIRAASPVLASADAGGILHYRRAYPADPHLRLWAGLVLLEQGRPALAAAEFKAAAGEGLDRGYLQQAIEAARRS